MKIWSYTCGFIRLCNSNNGQICFNMLSNNLLLLSFHFVTLQHVPCPIASGTFSLLLLLGLATLLPRPRILCILVFTMPNKMELPWRTVHFIFSFFKIKIAVWGEDGEEGERDCLDFRIHRSVFFFFCFILSCCFMIQQITNDFFLSSLDAKKS